MNVRKLSSSASDLASDQTFSISAILQSKRGREEEREREREIEREREFGPTASCNTCAYKLMPLSRSHAPKTPPLCIASWLFGQASEVETSSASPTGEAREFCESQFAETLDVLEVGGRSMSCHVTLRSTHVLEQEEVEALHNVWGEATFQRQGALAAAKSLLLHSRSPLADRWATHLHSGAKAVGSGGLAEVGWLVFFFGG